VNTLMLICASVAALGLGLVLAYMCCKLVFSALRMHARSLDAPAAPAKAQVARIS